MALTLNFIGLNRGGVAYNAGSGSFDKLSEEAVIDFTITLTGNYGTATSHGDPLDFTSMSIPAQVNIGQSAPTQVEIYEATQFGSAGLGYTYNYCPGPNISTLDGCTQAGGGLQIFGAGAGSGQGGTELTQGSAYSSFTPSLDSVVLRGRAYFARE